MSYSRYFRIPTPIARGMAVTPTSSSRDAATTEPNALPSRPADKVTAAPLASHFSC